MFFLYPVTLLNSPVLIAFLIDSYIKDYFNCKQTVLLLPLHSGRHLCLSVSIYLSILPYYIGQNLQYNVEHSSESGHPGLVPDLAGKHSVFHH